MLLDQIRSDLNGALRAGNRLKVEVLRYLLSALHNREIEKRVEGKAELSDEDGLEILSSQVKMRRESIEAFEKGGRLDLAEKEKRELEILSTYLPEQLSDAELGKLAKEASAEVGAKGIADMGKVMGALMPKVKGKAEGARVSEVVRRLLAG